MDTSLCNFIILCCCILHRIGHAEEVGLNWTLSQSRLPYKLKFQSAGYCDITEKIWLFGGTLNSISSYDINTEAVRTYNVPYSFRADASYNIKNGIIYFNSYGTKYISKFYTTNASFDWDYIQHPSMYFYFTVTTSLDNDILYILGGNQTTEFYLYNLTSFQWYQGHNYFMPQHDRFYAPFLTQNRLIKFSKTSLEYMDITGSIQDIIVRDWIVIDMDDVTEHNAGVAVDNEIWFIGGYGPTGSCCAKSGVQIIDTETFEISYGKTPITFSDAGIAYNPDQDIIYVLSGWSDNVGMLDRIYMINEYNISLGSFDDDDEEEEEDDEMNMSVAEIFCIILGVLLFLAIVIIIFDKMNKKDNKCHDEASCEFEMHETDKLNEIENEGGIGECEICMQYKKQYALVKCGHLVCGHCGLKLWKQDTKICPFCKQHISSIIKLYGLESSKTC